MPKSYSALLVVFAPNVAKHEPLCTLNLADMMQLLLLVTSTSLFFVWSLDVHRADLKEVLLEHIQSDDEIFMIKHDQVALFAETCGNRVLRNNESIVRLLQERPENPSIFEKMAQNTILIGRLLVERGLATACDMEFLVAI